MLIIVLLLGKVVSSSLTDTLGLVHVLVRHGHRNPSLSELYPSNPYLDESFYAPYGYGQLTNKGIKTLYRVGQRLRLRYDAFLGKEWNVKIVKVRSTAKSRARMSAAALLAGLWPPSNDQEWDPTFPWLPIPYSYVPAENDRELDPFNACSDQFWEELNHILEDKRIAEYMKRYDETLRIMSLNLKRNFTSPEAFVLYFGFLIQDQLGFPPESWTEAIYPEPLRSLAVDYYYLESNTTRMRQIMAGYFIEKILLDSEMQTNGKLEPLGRKMFVYVAHEINLATFLLSLDTFSVTDVPPYGSYVILEVHNMDGVHGVRLFYDDYSTSGLHRLKLPSCGYFCPLTDFRALLKNIIPKSNQACISCAYTNHIMPNRSMLDFSRLNMTYAGIWRFGPSSKRLIRFLYLLYSTFVFIYFPVFLTSLTIQFSIMLSFDEEFKAAPQKVFRTITLMITLWTVEIKAKLIQTARIKRIIAYILAEETKIRHSPDEDVARCYFEQAKFCRRSNLIIFSVTMTVATSMIVGNFVQCRQVEQHNRLRNDTISKSFTYELYYAGLDRKMAESVLEATNDLSVLIAASLVSSTQLVFISCMIFATSLIKIMQIRFRKMVTYGDDVVVTLRDLVLEHQKVIEYVVITGDPEPLISFVDQLNAAMKNLILLEYLLHSLNFASVSIQFIKSERNISMAFPVCYLGLLVVQTFFLGWNANEVKIQVIFCTFIPGHPLLKMLTSLMMADALYESPWYEQTQEVKGLLLVALTRSQRPLTLTIGPFDAMTVESSLTNAGVSGKYTFIHLVISQVDGMNDIGVLLAVLLTLWSSSIALPRLKRPRSTLELVHVVHRHGDRTPDAGSIYEGNRFTNESYYLPYGFGQLTNEGKQTEYNLGSELRQRYREFLGDVWNIDLIEARSTDLDRTKMSIQLSLAGLWPPTGVNEWNLLLNWQPIPYNYLPVTEDKELFGPFGACSTKFLAELNAVISSEETSAYIEARYSKILEVLVNNTGSASLLNAFSVYLTLVVQEELGLPLDEWTQKVYPEPLKSLAVDFYYLETINTPLRRIMAGYYLKKVLSDTERKINGTLTPSTRKLFLYSAHEQNIAGLVLSLDVFELRDVPAYGSYFIVELHKIEGVWGIKLFYQNYETKEPRALSLPGCDTFCPYDDFVRLVEDIIPESDFDCTG
ncbi:uncharacterized protein LOC132702372 [Cylas formicarius]|uniref:uncharacterized protein LOC132702372 n=1 Tax=Cylas formicarius TaxID=197179 RepID=UPI002958D13F|nr:uncharacterized protein LOC132702372 [Cylas formicarius]